MNNYNNDKNDNLKKEDQPFYSKYYVKNFAEDLKNTKFCLEFPEDLDENNLYWNLVEE